MYDKTTQTTAQITRKKKSSERKKLIKILDALVTTIVQERDGHCVTCGKTTGIYCGHYFSRANYSTRWDLTNCHAQCNPCNNRHEYDFYPYAKFMIDTYGQENIDKLYALHRTPSHFKVKDLEEIRVRLEHILRGASC